MGSSKSNIGNVEIVALSDASPQIPFCDLFPEVPAEAWEPYHQRYPERVAIEGVWRGNFGVYVLRSRGRTILVDTGIGPGPIEAMGGITGRLLSELADKGLRPEELDMVVCTHLHPDHVGWNLNLSEGKPQPTFPRARYLMPQADWDFFSRPENWHLFPWPYIQDSILPLRELGVLDLLPGEQALTEEVTAIPTPGHTPGHMSVLIVSAGERALVTGDIVFHPAQVTEVQWNAVYDGIPELARETRRHIIERIEAEGMVMASGHFVTPGLGRVIRLEGRRYWQAL